MTILAFRTISGGVKTPPSYTEELDLSGPGAPSGWTPVFTSNGSTPTFTGEMTAIPGTTGNSYIEKTSYGLDFINGFLIDLDLTVNTTNSGTTPGRGVIARIFLGGFGRVDIGFDRGINPEISLDSILNGVTNSAGVSLPNNDATVNFRVRLSIKGADSDNLVVKLYVGFDSDTGRLATKNVLQQTLGPSNTIGTTEDFIQLGTPILGSRPFATYRRIAILNGVDPDQYYNGPSVTSKSIFEGSVAGGDRLLIFGSNLDANIIMPPLTPAINLAWINDLSIGGGSSISNTISEQLRLEIVGYAASNNDRAIAKLAIPLNSEASGGIDLLFDVIADQNLITSPAGFEVIIFGIEIRSNDDIVAIEMISDISAGGAFFRAVHRTGSNIVGNIAGTDLLNQTLFTITQANYSFRIINNNGVIIIFINNLEVFRLGLSTNPITTTLYAKVAQPIDVTTIVKNFVVRPLVLFGEEIIDNFVSVDNSVINIFTPENQNVGPQDIIIRGPYGAISAGTFTYNLKEQEYPIGTNNDMALYVFDSIIKAKK